MKTRDLLKGPCLALLVVGGVSSGSTAGAQTPPRATLTAHAGVVMGTVTNAAGSAVAAARLRLRDLTSGRILMTTRADVDGGFRFTGVPRGTYLVELVDENGAVLAVGHTFPINPAETVVTLIRLGARAPWYSGFFSNAAMAVVSSAAGLGVTAVGNGFQPASARF